LDSSLNVYGTRTQEKTRHDQRLRENLQPIELGGKHRPNARLDVCNNLMHHGIAIPLRFVPELHDHVPYVAPPEPEYVCPTYHQRATKVTAPRQRKHFSPRMSASTDDSNDELMSICSDSYSPKRKCEANVFTTTAATNEDIVNSLTSLRLNAVGFQACAWQQVHAQPTSPEPALLEFDDSLLLNNDVASPPPDYASMFTECLSDTSCGNALLFPDIEHEAVNNAGTTAQLSVAPHVQQHAEDVTSIMMEQVHEYNAHTQSTSALMRTNNTFADRGGLDVDDYWPMFEADMLWN
jgi:hypothetical protein